MHWTGSVVRELLVFQEIGDYLQGQDFSVMDKPVDYGNRDGRIPEDLARAVAGLLDVTTTHFKKPKC